MKIFLEEEGDTGASDTGVLVGQALLPLVAFVL